MKNSRDGKSYSTNLAYTPPEFLRTGKINNLLSREIEFMLVLFFFQLYAHCVLIYFHVLE